MSIVAVFAEVPTGVLADTVSRKLSLVVSQVVLGCGMALMGFVTAYPLILVSQVLWGLGWTFTSGADVAWVTDELDDDARISGVLIAGARYDVFGSACGLAAFGALAWATDLGPAIVAAGGMMLVLGAVIAFRFPERNFTPAREDHLRASMAIFRRGVSLARRDSVILLILAATFLVNGGAHASGFLRSKQLLELGFPEDPEPIVWFTALGLVTLAVGAAALRIVEARIDGSGEARRAYAAACAAGAAGVLLLGYAPDAATGVAGVLLAGGIAWQVTRAVGMIWVNRRATSDVRATVHSFLGQAEYGGEIFAGLAGAVIAHYAGMTASFTFAAAIVAVALVLVVRGRE
jgi:MFS family permease